MSDANVEPTDLSLLAYHVRDALANLYDPVRLQTHPLAGMLRVRRAPGEMVGESLRRLLREAVEAFRPPSSVPLEDNAWVNYRILQMRYIQSLDPGQICRELGLSQPTFYRHHRDALQAVVSILAEGIPGPAGDEVWTTRASSPIAEDAQALNGRQEAVSLAQKSQREMTNLREVLDDAVLTFLPLASAQGVRLQVEAPSRLPAAYVDAGLMHQIIVNILLASMKLTEGGVLRLSVSETSEQTIWQIEGLEPNKVVLSVLEDCAELSMSRSLLEIYGGRIWIAKGEGGSKRLNLTVPTSVPQTIMVIDDDEDAVVLYKRFLEGHHYCVRTSPNAEAVMDSVVQSPPHLILLDVLMPRENGWQLLQRLRTLPATRQIPVVVCSVLSQPELALSLGASRVLHKPVTRADLLSTVRQVLAEARDLNLRDSEAAGPQA